MIPFLKSLLFDATRFTAVLGVGGVAAIGALGDDAPSWLVVAVAVVIAIGAPAHQKVANMGDNA